MENCAANFIAKYRNGARLCNSCGTGCSNWFNSFGFRMEFHEEKCRKIISTGLSMETTIHSVDLVSNVMVVL